MYYDQNSRDAHRQGQRDANWGYRARTQEYNRYSNEERDRAYYEGYREEQRRQEYLTEQCRQEEEARVHAEQRYRHEQEEQMFFERQIEERPDSRGQEE